MIYLPLVTVRGLTLLKAEEMKQLEDSIRRAVMSIKELELDDEKKVKVSVPFDQNQFGMIYVEVTKIFKGSERTDQVFMRLMRELWGAVRVLYPEMDLECYMLPPIDPKTQWYRLAK